VIAVIRVQMVRSGMLAYQAEFDNEAEAVSTAESIAAGCGDAKKDSVSGCLISFSTKGGFVRAVDLGSYANATSA